MPTEVSPCHRYGRGEGFAAILLVPGSAGPLPGILAVVRGSAINQDGRSSSLTAPNGPSQTALIKACLAASRLQPQQLKLVSVHGTGTQLGDPIEVGAIGQALAQGRAPGLHHVALVSNKSCFGHTEGAAGDLVPSYTWLICLLLCSFCCRHARCSTQARLGQDTENEQV